MKLFKTYGPKWLGIGRYFPYPLRAARISIDFNPFGFWAPRYVKNKLTEQQKINGDLFWYIRFAWFQISYSRWL